MERVVHEREREFGGRRYSLRLVVSDELPPIERITSALALAFRGDALLLIESPNHGWQVPGGHIEAGETPELAMAREVFEEAATVVEGAWLLGYERIELLDEDRTGYKYPVPSYQVFFVTKVVEQHAFVPHDEARAVRLFPPDEAEESDWVRDVGDFYRAGLALAGRV